MAAVVDTSTFYTHAPGCAWSSSFPVDLMGNVNLDTIPGEGWAQCTSFGTKNERQDPPNRIAAARPCAVSWRQGSFEINLD